MKEFIEKNLENMKKDLKDLVAINSVYADDVAPFGSANRQVLDLALAKFAQAGMQTSNLDYYCGYGEIGEGEKVIGIVAHLDVVPAGDGWDGDPFVMEEKDGYLYGRGVSDDKGAVIASLYALKYLMANNYPFKKRVRLIVGCNEESGSKCIEHYVKKEGHVDLGFTPDGNFPGIYAEKGIYGARMVGKTTKIKAISGGLASNVVCKKVNATIPANTYDQGKFKAFMAEHQITFDLNGDEITVYGTAAHASTPDLGVNAISHLLEALYVAGINDPFVDAYHEFIGLTVHGEKLHLDSLKDEISDASCNIGMISCADGVITATVDVRFPVKSKADQVIALVEKAKKEDFAIITEEYENPLYFSLDSSMIKALDKAYRTVTKDNVSQMEAIGGGTYAKAINNIIAFGCEFQGEDNHIHDANEKLAIESFKKQIEIYVEAIKNLNEVA